MSEFNTPTNSVSPQSETDHIELAMHILHVSPEEEPAVMQEAAPAQMEATEMGLNETEGLARKMIDYVLLQPCRLLHAMQPEIWLEFQANEYYTPSTLSKHFIEVVLPSILEQDLSEREQSLLEVLELHPEFRRVAMGYERLPREERVAASREPQPEVDYRLLTTLINSREIFATLMEPNASHTLVMSQPYQRQRSGDDYQFSNVNAALLSAALNSDMELSAVVLLEPRELHERLRLAKRQFEQLASMPLNCQDAEQLLQKMSKLKQLKTAIAEIMAKRFL